MHVARNFGAWRHFRCNKRRSNCTYFGIRNAKPRSDTESRTERSRSRKPRTFKGGHYFGDCWYCYCPLGTDNCSGASRQKIQDKISAEVNVTNQNRLVRFVEKTKSNKLRAELLLSVLFGTN